LIPQRNITLWTQTAPWPTDEQVEQDLLLSRLIVEIANDAYLGDELIFRGGTCLHKLRLVPGLRYSEDLDYVRTSAGGIGDLAKALRDIGERLGMKVSVEISKYPKVKFRAPFESGRGSMRIKIEVNTYERSPALPLERVPFAVESAWFTGSAEVLTFDSAELVATKIRALYQRSKGRDIFDLWAALTQLGLAPLDIIAAFGPYRPEGLTSALSIANLETKLTKADFRDDVKTLTRRLPSDYDIDAAASLISSTVLAALDEGI
jgi:Nucleotidyl transferase AbiEii toxin, Type IV TA system